MSPIYSKSEVLYIYNELNAFFSPSDVAALSSAVLFCLPPDILVAIVQ